MTASKNDFYIGYQDRAPASYARFLKRFVAVLIIALLVAAFLIVRTQRGFSTGTFELGKLTEITGTVSHDPVPMITLDGNDESILLIGYGKFGAEGALLRALPDDIKVPLTYKATLQGTLIYHDGKTLLELTKQEKSVISWELIEEPVVAADKLGSIALRGQIIDPKCYFGVMKPGEGKIHRSCAIRCISGGIPPILKVSDDAGNKNYFIMRGQNGQAINDMVLDYVAEPVEITGEAYQFRNWTIVNIDESFGIQPLLN